VSPTADLLRALARLGPDRRAQIALCDRALSGSHAAARKACWTYSHFLWRTGQPVPDQQQFVRGFLSAWRSSLLHLVNGPQARYRFPAFENLDRVLLLCWHFPEYPLLLHTRLARPLTVLIASEQAWMASIRTEHSLCCFRRDRQYLRLPRVFRQGDPVFAMIDHWYAGTRSVVTPFLSYPAHLPSGVLELARRFGYRVALLSVRQRTLAVVREWWPPYSVPSLAEQINTVLEQEILARPHRWLQWPSLPDRWIGVDYGDG
jgi:hypothetical protein